MASPSGVCTTTGSVPEPGGTVTLTESTELVASPLPGVPPKSMPVVAPRSVPVIVMVLPSMPALGVIAVADG